MRRLFVILAILLACGMVIAQSPGTGGLVRSYPFMHSGAVGVNYPCDPPNNDCVTACWNFGAAVGAYTDDCRGLYTMAVNGAPVRVTDATYPTGDFATQGYAWRFGGAADWLSRADDGSFDMDLTNNPTGHFSVQCVVTTRVIDALEGYILARYSPVGDQRAWALVRSTANWAFRVSKDGTSGAGSLSNLIRAATIHSPAFITATYEWVTDGTSRMRLYVNNEATVSSNVAVGPVWDSTADFTIGAYHGGFGPFNGLIHDCKVYKGLVITEAEHDAMFHQWRHGTLIAPPTVTSATPSSLLAAAPASGTEPFIIPQPANTGMVVSPDATRGGMYAASAITNLFRRAVFRTWAGAHGTCGDCPTGLVCWCAAGDGSAAMAPDTTRMAVDGQSARMTLTGTTSVAVLYSTCRVAEIGQNLRFSTYRLCAAGACEMPVILRQYTAAADCTGAFTDTVLLAAAAPATWTKAEATWAAGAWNGATQSYRILLIESGDGGVTSHWSAPQLTANAAAIPLSTDAFCGTDADADAVCTTSVLAHPSALSAAGAATIEVTASTPYAGTDLAGTAWLLTDGASGAANTYGISLDSGTDEPMWTIYDGAAAGLAIQPNVLDWAATTDYTLRAAHDGRAHPRLWWNGAWQTATVGVGTGLRGAGQATTSVGGSDVGGSDIYIRNLRYYRRVLP
jgi:hypothetical protein